MHNPNNKECPYNATRRGENWAKDGDCHCPPEQKVEKIIEQWEVDFNTKFIYAGDRTGSKLKDFIRTLLTNERERIKLEYETRTTHEKTLERPSVPKKDVGCA